MRRHRSPLHLWPRGFTRQSAARWENRRRQEILSSSLGWCKQNRLCAAAQCYANKATTRQFVRSFVRRLVVCVAGCKLSNCLLTRTSAEYIWRRSIREVPPSLPLSVQLLGSDIELRLRNPVHVVGTNAEATAFAINPLSS